MSMEWISNYSHGFLWDLITHPWPHFNGVTAVGGLAWRSNLIPLFYVNMITYPCTKLDAGLANLHGGSRPSSNSQLVNN